jgi:hypothetical protein
VAAGPAHHQPAGSWTRTHHVSEVDAEELGPSLRWATATLTRTDGRRASGQVNEEPPS